MLEKIPQKKDSFIWREIDGETFILSETGKKIITLNKVASFIWQKCNGRQSLKQICDDILEKFAVDRELAEKDLYRFVGEMQQNQMIDFIPGNSAKR